MLARASQSNDVNLQRFYEIDPQTGLTPLQAAVKERHAHGDRRWDLVAKILRTPDLDYEKAGAGYVVLIAAKENYTLVVQQLMEKVDDFSFCSGSNDYYPQHWAVVHDNAVMLEVILANGASPNQPSRNNLSPFDLALLRAKPSKNIIKCLCKYGLIFGDRLLRLAKQGKWQLVRMILQLDQRKQAEIKSELLMEAIDQNRREMVAYLTRSGAMQQVHKNLLKYAATTSKWRCVRVMIRNMEAQTLSRLMLGTLAVAAAEREWQIVGKLLAHKLPDYSLHLHDNLYRGKTALQWLVQHDNKHWLLAALNAGIHVINDRDSSVSMLTAVQLRSADGVRLLASYNADVFLAWHHLVSEESWPGIRFMLRHDQRNYHAYVTSSLEDIARNASLDFLSELIARYQVSIGPALDAASRQGHWDSVCKLLQASPDYRNYLVLQPMLKVAIDRDDQWLFQQLLAHEVAIDLKVCSGKLPAIYAAERGRWNHVHLLAGCKEVDPSASGLISVLHYAANSVRTANWDVVRTIATTLEGLNNKALFGNVCVISTAMLAVHANRPDILAPMLRSGLDGNLYDDMLEVAEKNHYLSCARLLVKHGAKNHNKILKVASQGLWNQVLSLLHEHYVVNANVNETVSDRKFIVGRLLHVLVQRLEHDVYPFDDNYNRFHKLMNFGADFRVVEDHKDLVQLMTERKVWTLFGRTLPLVYESVPNQERLGYALITAIKNQAPYHIIEQLGEMITDINSVIEPGTGNNLLHLAVLARHARLVELFVNRGVSSRVVNYDKKMPIHYVYTMPSGMVIDERRKEMARLIMGTSEWLDAHKFDSNTESYGDTCVQDSLNRSLLRLIQRYPHVNVELCFKQYSVFLNKLAEPLKSGGHYQGNNFRAKWAIALIWTAANDKSAVPAAQSKNPKFILQRCEALVEQITQAKKDNKCQDGMFMEVITALNHAHPDVIITYIMSHLKGEVSELIENRVHEYLPSLLASLKTDAQLVSARQLHCSDVTPAFYALLKRKIEDEILRQYREHLPLSVIDSLLAPAELAKVKYVLPAPFVRFIAVLNEIQSFISKSEQSSITSVDDMNYLRELLHGEHDDESRSLMENADFLECELKKCVALRSGDSLQAISLFKPQQQHHATMNKGSKKRNKVSYHKNRR